MKFAAALLSAATLAFVASAAPTKREFDTHTAPATFYSQGSSAGSCGNYNSDSSYVVAMPGWLHQSENCGKQISITRGSNTITATIADTCPECEGYHIDLSKVAFGALASYEEGEVDVEWHTI